jgi:hypothetical protein
MSDQQLAALATGIEPTLEPNRGFAAAGGHGGAVEAADPSVSRKLNTAAPGLRFSWRAGGGNITSTVESFEPPLAVGWTGRSIGTRAVHIWRLAKEAAGTRVETEEWMEGWFPSLPLFGPQARKSMRRAVSATVAEFKIERALQRPQARR